MKVYMTNGTLVFLKKIAKKHPTVQFHFMNDGNHTTAYYENHSKKIFSAGRIFQALLIRGTIKDTGYVSMHHIPVSTEDRLVFETHFKHHEHMVTSIDGLHAFRLLKPRKGNTYIIFTQWESVRYYEQWKTTEEYDVFHHHGVKPPAYFADRSYVASYFMADEEE